MRSLRRLKAIIDGRTIVEQGKVRSVDEPALTAELLAQARACVRIQAGGGAWRNAVAVMAEDLGPFYRSKAYLSCC